MSRTCRATRLSYRIRDFLEKMLNSRDTGAVIVASALDEVASNAGVEGKPTQASISFLTAHAREIKEWAEHVIMGLGRLRAVELKTTADQDRVEIHYKDCLRAERRGGDVLVLRSNQGAAAYELTYLWLAAEDANIREVQGSEISYWFAGEVDPAKSLFDQFRLFP